VQYSTYRQYSTYVWQLAHSYRDQLGRARQTTVDTVRPEIETLSVYSTALYGSTVSTVFRLLLCLLRDWFGPSIHRSCQHDVPLPVSVTGRKMRLPSRRIVPDSVKIVLTDFTGPREARHARAACPQRSPQPFIPRSLSQAGKAELFGACLRRHPMHGRCGHRGVERVAIEATMAVASWRWTFSSKSKSSMHSVQCLQSLHRALQ
jgi:hypothetical protein